jgi:hypothetical protein
MDVVWIELIKTVPILVFSIARATNHLKWMECVCLEQEFKTRLHPKIAPHRFYQKPLKQKKRLVLIPKSKFVIREKKTETPSGFFGLLNGFLNFPLAFVS